MQKLLSKREKLIGYLTVGAVVAAILFNFLVVPILSKADSLNREVNYNRAKLTKYLWLLSQKEYLQNKYGKYPSVIKAPSQQQDSAIGALSTLEGLAKGADIRIIDLRPQGSASSAAAKGSPVDLRTEGTMEGYLKFIYDLENSLSLLKIKEFQLSAKPNSKFLEGNFSIYQLSVNE
jgi:hypothetical protein